MVVVPAASVVTSPVDEPIVATDISVLVHEPPAGPSLIVTEAPRQILEAPETGNGVAFTVTTEETRQPVGYP